MKNFDLKFQRTLENYLDLHESLSRRSLPLLKKHLDEEVVFSDPFLGEVKGSADMLERLGRAAAMFHKLRIEVDNYAFARDGYSAFVRWRLHGVTKSGDIGFKGVSELCFTPQGLVSSQINFWDVGAVIYERVPVIGDILRTRKCKALAPEKRFLAPRESSFLRRSERAGDLLRARNRRR